MKFLFLHLSDIHMKAQPNSNPILGRVNEIGAALASVTPECRACFVIVSGDIAFSGKAEEYLFATEFFENLKKEIIRRIKACKTVCCFVPGNHDCDFTLQNSLREMIIANYSPKTFDETMLDTCLQVQNSYDEFVLPWQSSLTQCSPTKKAIDIQSIEIDDQVIEFRLINSSILSTLNEKQGALFFPAKFMSFISDKTRAPNIVVSVLHHPYNWFESTNARNIRDVLEASSDIIFTGHEHEDDSFRKTRATGGEVDYIEGAVLQKHQDRNESHFNVVLYDLDNQTQRLHKFSWVSKGRYEEIVPSRRFPLLRNSYRLRNVFTLAKEFDEFLVDPGAPYTHSSKERLILNDIFVYPHIRIQSHHNGDTTRNPRIVQENILGFIEDEKRVLLIGTEKSGKTCLTKTLFQDLRKRGYIPILLRGEDLKKPDESHILKAIEKAYQSQYATPDITTYHQLECEKRAIIIDDFHNSPVNTRGRDLIVSNLETRASIIILLGDERIRFDDLVDRDIDDLKLWKYTTVEIMPFGHVKRYELIKKWIFMGRTYTHDELQLMRQVSIAERLITEIIGKNLAPSYPLFILTVLQQIEIQTPIRTSTVSGSYGFLYETLLTISLTRASQLKLDLDTQYSYLSEYAYYLFTAGVRYLTHYETYDWHQGFCKEHQRRLDFKEITTNLFSASILTDNEGKISFRYPYLYYYFLGRYFRDHINDEGIRSHIVAMSKRLHHEESANVLMFLSYLSKDPLILSSIIYASKEFFSTYDECDVVSHTKFLTHLIEEVPSLILDGDDAEARRKEILKKEDDIESDKPTSNEDGVVNYTDVVTDDEIQEFLRINVAFKTIQILGQILRNYPGSLKGTEKLEVAREAYSLGLRVLKFMYSGIEANQEELVQFFAELLRDKHPNWMKDDITRDVCNMIFYLSEGLSFVVTKHIADSVGHEDLSMTFDELLKGSSNISYRFIDLSIRLFNYSDFPKDEILQLYRDVRKNPFAAQLVRHIVWFYLYIFPVSESLLQSICKKLDIQIQPVLRDTRPKLLKG